jgi:hypothetical protein
VFLHDEAGCDLELGAVRGLLELRHLVLDDVLRDIPASKLRTDLAADVLVSADRLRLAEREVSGRFSLPSRCP